LKSAGAAVFAESRGSCGGRKSSLEECERLAGCRLPSSALGLTHVDHLHTQAQAALAHSTLTVSDDLKKKFKAFSTIIFPFFKDVFSSFLFYKK